MGYTWVEPFAGAAAVALRLVGGRQLLPPVAWMGGKRRYARAIADAMGVPDGKPGRVLLADAGPWGWVWPLLLDPVEAARVALVLRSWKGEHPRELWQRLAAEPPPEDVYQRAAQWLWLQARSASGVPIWWDGWRHTDGRGRKASDRGEDLRWPAHQSEHERWVSTRTQQKGGVRDAKHAMDTRRWESADHGSGRTQRAGQAMWVASDGRGEPRPAGARGLGSWRFDARPGDAQPDRLAGPAGRTNGRTGGMVNPATIAERIEAIALAFAGVEWSVFHDSVSGPAGLVVVADSQRGGNVYACLDPPYVGATGYGWDCPRAEVLALARAWESAGAVVAISEAEPLLLQGWYHLELTRPGGKPEWLALAREPVRVPEVQRDLFSEEGA